MVKPFIFARAFFYLCVDRPLVIKMIGNGHLNLSFGKKWMLSMDPCHIIAHFNIVHGDLKDLKVGASDYWYALFIYDDLSAFI